MLVLLQSDRYEIITAPGAQKWEGVVRKKAFTILEIVIAIVIVGILGTLGIPAYQNVLESSKDKVCTTNLKTLQKGLDIYIMERGTVPGSLAELKREHLDKAYAQVMSEKGGWKKRLAYFIVEGPKWGRAYAQADYLPHLRCPKNPDTSPAAISYGLRDGVANLSAAAYKLLPGNTVIIADANLGTFDYFAGNSGNIPSNPHSDFNTTRATRGHKRNNITSVETYLKGVTKAGTTGRLTTHSFSLDTTSVSY
ncbi:MAG: prepilin-type N-terminal cleavage/methylation domain-containing protein [Candidatus Omnitrophota bacterium]